MPTILLMLGILVAGAGSGAIEFGILVNEFSLRSALISAGTTALTGGLILIALAAVVSELKRLGEALRARPGTRPARSSADVPEPGVALDPVAAAPPRSSHSAPAPVPSPPRPMAEASPRDLSAVEPRQVAYSAVDLSASPIERLRPMVSRIDRIRPEPSIVANADEIPSPNGARQQRGRHIRPFAAETVVEGKSEHAVHPDHAADTSALKTSRLDFLFRAKPARPAPSERFDAVWGADRRAESVADAEPRLETSANSAADFSSSVESAPAVAILKSGAVNGMAYTLYADGAIDAELPQGTARFSSIAELRAHVENNSLPNNRRRTSDERGASRVLPSVV
jgi:hypothetical protein